MQAHFDQEHARLWFYRLCWSAVGGVAALALAACTQAGTASGSGADASKEKAVAAEEEEPEFPEFAATPEELADAQVNEIVKSLRLNTIAMHLGRAVYDANCASCHGEDLKGVPAQHAPNLTDAEWMFSGDDLQSGGLTKFPSDVEWTVRYGIRSGHVNARGREADMLAYDPKYRNEGDLKAYGNGTFLTDQDVEDVVEFVMKIGGQQADAAMAARGSDIFQNKGNCFDCHTEEATGNPPIGSINLTRPDLYLYGTDRASIKESILQGRHGIMPAFEGKLKPEEIKAVAVYVFSRAANPANP